MPPMPPPPPMPPKGCRPCRRRPCPRRCRRCSACRPPPPPNRFPPPLQRASRRARRPQNGLPPGAPPPKGEPPAGGCWGPPRPWVSTVLSSTRKAGARPKAVAVPERADVRVDELRLLEHAARRHAHPPQRRLELLDAHLRRRPFRPRRRSLWRRRRFLRRRRLVGGDVDVLVLRPPSRLFRAAGRGVGAGAGAGAGALGTSSPFLNARPRFASSSFSPQSS